MANCNLRKIKRLIDTEKGTKETNERDIRKALQTLGKQKKSYFFSVENFVTKQLLTILFCFKIVKKVISLIAKKSLESVNENNIFKVHSRICTLDPSLHSFHSKMLRNVIYLTQRKTYFRKDF